MRISYHIKVCSQDSAKLPESRSQTRLFLVYIRNIKYVFDSLPIQKYTILGKVCFHANNLKLPFSRWLTDNQEEQQTKLLLCSLLNYLSVKLMWGWKYYIVAVADPAMSFSCKTIPWKCKLSEMKSNENVMTFKSQSVSVADPDFRGWGVKIATLSVTLWCHNT